MMTDPLAVLEGLQHKINDKMFELLQSHGSILATVYLKPLVGGELTYKPTDLPGVVRVLVDRVVEETGELPEFENLLPEVSLFSISASPIFLIKLFSAPEVSGAVT